MVRKTDDGTDIYFIDHTSEKQSGQHLFVISVILGVVGLVVFALLSYFLSGLMVRPVEEAFEKQKQFISDASHELKTPITVILSNSELLEDQIGDNQWLSYIKNECDRMRNLVESLLTLTKLEQTPYDTLEKHEFSLSDAMLERILPFESVAFEKKITMNYQIEPDISFVGVKEQLQQVLTILIDNALNHTEENGNIDITLQKTAHHVRFVVSNTGEPIPEESREKLFERFYRVDKARKRSEGHYGLGLSIAKTIIETHKGKIHVECAEGITSFIVTLKQVEK
jgi:signal transduction histidine kinase